MKELDVNIKDISQIISLVRVLSGLHEDFDLKCGHFTVDAKSILGMLSLDLKNPAKLIIYSDDASVVNFIERELEEIEKMGDN